jgi:hypothetical protein
MAGKFCPSTKRFIIYLREMHLGKFGNPGMSNVQQQQSALQKKLAIPFGYNKATMPPLPALTHNKRVRG